MEELKQRIRNVPDFPKPGILFYDVTTLLEDRDGFRLAVDAMADIARGTHLPIATGERIFTKWGFREILEKRAATILQPDLCHAGGIFETRLIAGMAEAYYSSVAPHNPLGPISLAAGIQLAASVPNFL